MPVIIHRHVFHFKMVLNEKIYIILFLFEHVNPF